MNPSRRFALAGVAVVAAAAAAGLIALSDGSAPAARSGGPAAVTPAPLLAGVPQHGFTLGSPKAPVTMVDFLDLQCPVCREFDQAVMPSLLPYVRAGKLRIELRIASILGPQSAIAGRALAAAALQNRAFDYVEAFYARQREENSGYVVPSFLAGVGRAAGADVSRLMRDSNGLWAAGTVTRHMRSFAQLGFQGTPSFQIGRTGATLSVLRPSSLAPGEFTGPIDSLLG